MTDVLIDLGRDAPGGRQDTTGVLVAKASRTRAVDASVTLPAPVRVTLTAGENRVALDAPGAGWYWRLEVYVDRNLALVREAVTFSGVEVEWADLTDVDPESLDPVAAPAWEVAAERVDTAAADAADARTEAVAAADSAEQARLGALGYRTEALDARDDARASRDTATAAAGTATGAASTAETAAASVQRGVAGGVAPLDADGNATDASGEKLLTPTAANATYVAQRGACHIVVAGGQSNAVQSDTTIPIAAADYRLYKWDGSAIVPLPATETYLLPSFAREYAKTLPAGDWILVVPCAVGSSGFTSTSISPAPTGYHNYPSPGTWDRTLAADTNNFYASMVAETLQAKTAAQAITATVTIDALLWSQGEEDTPFLTESAYAAKLDDLIAQFRTDVAVALLPVIVGSMVPEYAALRGQVNTAGVAAALAKTPTRNPGGFATAFVFGPEGLPKTGEVIHYSTAAQIRRGALFLDGLYRARVNRATTPPVPPTGLTVIREASGQVTLRWQPPLSRVTGYNVDFSFDGGSTWIVGTLDPDSRLKATSAAFSWEPVKARIRTLSDGSIAQSEWVYSAELAKVQDGTFGTARKFVHGESISPAHTGAMTLYSVFTLPASGGEVTINARSNDSTRQFYLSAVQASAVDWAAATTGGGSPVVSFAAPKAVAGQHINAAALSADGVTLRGKRGSATSATATATAGNILAETLRLSAPGGAVSDGAYIFLGYAHDEATMTTVQEILRRRHGYTTI